MSTQSFGCHYWGHAMKGKWGTTVSPQHFETQVITLNNLSKKAWFVTIKGSVETTWNFSWHWTCPVERWEALKKGAEGLFLSFPPWASWEHKLFTWGTAFTFIVMFSQHSVPHSDILYAWICSNVVVGICRTPWNLGITVFCLLITLSLYFYSNHN